MNIPGKTSLCNALYRLYPLTWGTIEIDGINTAHIGLHRLRRGMAVIPQDPTLFAGTVRFNVDPNKEFSDDQIWMALEKTYLKDMVRLEDYFLFFFLTVIIPHFECLIKTPLYVIIIHICEHYFPVTSLH